MEIYYLPNDTKNGSKLSRKLGEIIYKELINPTLLAGARGPNSFHNFSQVSLGRNPQPDEIPFYFALPIYHVGYLFFVYVCIGHDSVCH